jgi:hypothetical protein
MRPFVGLPGTYPDIYRSASVAVRLPLTAACSPLGTEDFTTRPWARKFPFAYAGRSADLALYSRPGARRQVADSIKDARNRTSTIRWPFACPWQYECPSGTAHTIHLLGQAGLAHTRQTASKGVGPKLIRMSNSSSSSQLYALCWMDFTSKHRNEFWWYKRTVAVRIYAFNSVM